MRRKMLFSLTRDCFECSILNEISIEWIAMPISARVFHVDYPTSKSLGLGSSSGIIICWNNGNTIKKKLFLKCHSRDSCYKKFMGSSEV